MADKAKEYRVYIQSYDGATAVITDQNGNQLNPTEASITMVAGELHVAHLTFVLINTDVEAYLDTVTMVCPVCELHTVHQCNNPESPVEVIR